ncbi:MAG: glycoside hydrolase family 3 C-terminal domain-containing protein [Candidatus Izemoplasmatales bacterium]|nr:glycoside hydrolase family 3 C-terminal domain-containing protein [Candidatus Izemoplasmatales bacterium]
MDIEHIISELTREEKCALLVGFDHWRTYPIPRLDIPSIQMADGPHGLRKEADPVDPLQTKTIASVCYPPAVTLASSFDPEITFQVGEAIGKECRKEQVHVLLGPGINIKRNPLCGRSFEYYSEDPYLTAQMARGFVNGLKSQQVGACIKHFALNNQESHRMVSSSIADERAKHELYFRAFHDLMDTSPEMVMCSYNKVDDVFASENIPLLKEVLRGEFGFNNVIVSDWTAVKNRTQALKASLDLEMPGNPDSCQRISADLSSGEITEEMMNDSIRRLLTLIQEKRHNQPIEVDMNQQHEIAKKAASSSIVLLKNEDQILPVKPTESIALIGMLAKSCRFQGGGSSHVTPYKVDQLIDLMPQGVQYQFAPGYTLTGDGLNHQLIMEAAALAKTKAKVILVIGLTDEYESEGYDRSHLDLPLGHQVLLEKVASVNPNLIVICQMGSPIRMPWISKVKGLVNAYLGGEAGAAALIDNLYGKENPSGRLAETFALSLDDIPSNRRFAKGNNQVYYQESIYVGYRYFSTAKKRVLFPFGYGLSYTSFSYADLIVPDKAVMPQPLSVSVRIRNSGTLFGREVVQCYVRNPLETCSRPICELRGFKKISLEPNEEKTVSFDLGSLDFSIYHPDLKKWIGISGIYDIAIQKNAEDICLSRPIQIQFSEDYPTPEKNQLALSYTVSGGLTFSDQDFSTLIDRPLNQEHIHRARPYHLDDEINDLAHTLLGRLLKKIAVRIAWKTLKRSGTASRKAAEKSVGESTPRSLVLFSGGKIKLSMMEGIIHLCNRHFRQAFKQFFKGGKS